MWRDYNANPDHRRTIDCTTRAISQAMGQSWERTYLGICIDALLRYTMPSADEAWGAYLHRHGYRRHLIEAEDPTTYTVADFCRDHPRGTYLLAISGHVVCVIHGDYYDAWDSGACIPVYYWHKEADD